SGPTPKCPCECWMKPKKGAVASRNLLFFRASLARDDFFAVWQGSCYLGDACPPPATSERGEEFIIRKLLVGVSFAGMLALGASGASHAFSVTQSAQQEQKAQSVSGTVKAIGGDHRSFTLEVGDGDAKNTMEFVLDDNSKVQGRIVAGTLVAVTYQQNGGKNVALSVSAQS